MVSPDDTSPPSAFGFLLTVGVIVLIIFFILTRNNANCLKRGKKGGGDDDFLDNLGEVIDNKLVTHVEIDEQYSINQINTIDEENISDITQNIDDHSGNSDQLSATNSHESEGDISWLGRVYRSMSISVDEGVTWNKKFVRGKRQSDGGGSKRKRGRGAGRSRTTEKPSPPPKAKVHSSKLQLSGSKRR